MEEKRALLVSTESNVETEMILDLLRQNDIPAVSQGKQDGEALEAYMGFSPYGDDIFVNQSDLEKASEIIDSL